MPRIGLGTWQLTGEAAERGAEHALELGYRLIDTSGDYDNERSLGRALRASGLEREEVFVIGKVEEDEDPVSAVGERLEELGLEELDLCLLHRPPSDGAGEDLWQGLLEARREALTEAVGVSNYSIPQIDRLIEDSDHAPVVNQIEWSPFGYSDEMLDYGRQREIVIQAYSPLTRGERLDDETVTTIAGDRGRTPAQVLLRWHLQLGTAPIPKAASAEHRRENLEVFDFELSPEEMDQLDRLNERYSSLAGLPYV